MSNDPRFSEASSSSSNPAGGSGGGGVSTDASSSLPRPLSPLSNSAFSPRGPGVVPNNPAYDQSMRRLLLLQTLAARQTALIQAQAASIPPPSSRPPFTSAAPATFSLPPRPTPNHSRTPSSAFDSPQSPHLSHIAPTPPPTPSVVDPWEGIIGSLETWPSGNHQEVNNLNHSSAAGVGSSGAIAGGSGLGANWTLDEKELQLAQEQLDAWTSQVFNSTVPPPPLTVPPLLAASAMPLTWPPPPPNVAPSPLFPGLSTPQLPQPATVNLSTVRGMQTRRSSAENEAENERESRESAARSKSKSKGKSKSGDDVDMGGRSDEGSGDEDDKRRRNTEASARFRAKKKQRDAELQQTSAQLRERVTELEKQAGLLKAENQWLRDLISEKTEPRAS